MLSTHCQHTVLVFAGETDVAWNLGPLMLYKVCVLKWIRSGLGQLSIKATDIDRVSALLHANNTVISSPQPKLLSMCCWFLAYCCQLAADTTTEKTPLSASLVDFLQFSFPELMSEWPQVANVWTQCWFCSGKNNHVKKKGCEWQGNSWCNAITIFFPRW